MYKSITACEGWYHLHEDKFTRIAAWGVTEEGAVVGLVYEGAMDHRNTPVLTRTKNGRYVHQNDLGPTDSFNFSTRTLQD